MGGKPFVGLPGNPVAVYVTLLFVVRPLLARLGGEAYAPPRGFTVRAAFSYRKQAGRREFVRASLALGRRRRLASPEIPARRRRHR